MYGDDAQAIKTAENALRAVQISFHSQARGWLMSKDDFGIELFPRQD